MCRSNIGQAAVDQETATADTGGQPLTRAACDGAGMQWDEASNVCGSESGVNTSGQPLSRAACVEAGMKWNEISNVCGVSVKPLDRPAAQARLKSRLMTMIAKATAAAARPNQP